MLNKIKQCIGYLALVTAGISTFGSLFFSEVMKFPPCVLCWYQRILMFPIAIILAVGLFRKDKKVYTYVLPLSILGIIISSYHNLLYYKLIPESIQPCIAGVSCTTKFFEWFGFITIPFLSLTAFVVITITMLLYRKYK